MQDELNGVTPSDTIISVAPVRAGPGVTVLSAEGTPLSPEQKDTSRFADIYHDAADRSADAGLSWEAYNARLPAEKGGFLRA